LGRVALLLSMALIILLGCSEIGHAQTIKITVSSVNVTGLITKVEYYRDGKLLNSLNIIDASGDGIIDGKSGPSQDGNWPKGWEWFDDMYHDVVVGHSTIAVVDEKIKIQDSATYEFVTGEYECEQIG